LKSLKHSDERMLLIGRLLLQVPRHGPVVWEAICHARCDPEVAHEKAVARRQQKAQSHITAAEWQLMEEKIRQDWSPEQVAERLKRDHEVQISHE
jgi:hypothetical protein